MPLAPERKAGRHPMKVRDVLTVDVEDVALGGKALARVDGRVVFLDRGLPGDRVGARVTKTTRRSAEARLVSLELPSPLTVEVVGFTQRFAAAHRWRAYHPSRHDGVARFLVVRHLAHTASCAVHLLAASDELPGLEAWAHGVAALSGDVRTVTLGINRGRGHVAFAEEERALIGDGVVVERLLWLEFEVVGNAVLQTNTAQAEALYTGALAAAGGPPRARAARPPPPPRAAAPPPRRPPPRAARGA